MSVKAIQTFFWILGTADVLFIAWWAIHVSQGWREDREELARCQNKYWVDYATDELDRKTEELKAAQEDNYKLQMEVARLTAQQEQNVKTVSDYREKIEQKKMTAPVQIKDENGRFTSTTEMTGKQKYFYAAVMKRAQIDKWTISTTLHISENNVAPYASRGKLEALTYSDEDCQKIAHAIIEKADAERSGTPSTAQSVVGETSTRPR